MTRMILLARDSLYQDAYARQSPKLSAPAVRRRTAQQGSFQLLELSRAQTRFASGPSRTPECSGSPYFPSPIPAGYALSGDLKLTGHRSQRPLPFAKKKCCLPTPLFQPREIATCPLCHSQSYGIAGTVSRCVAGFCHSITRNSIIALCLSLVCKLGACAATGQRRGTHFSC